VVGFVAGERGKTAKVHSGGRKSKRRRALPAMSLSNVAAPDNNFDSADDDQSRFEILGHNAAESERGIVEQHR